MSDNGPCTQSCGMSCPRNAVGTGAANLSDILARFEREAVHGHCDTGRYRLPYYSWGAGPPLVFIHGVGDISRSFVLLISRLTSQFRCIAYNLPLGCEDGARLSRYQHADLVQDLWALLDHLGLSRSYLYGSSFGATIALRAMRDRPERVPRAILQGGSAHRPLRGIERFLTWILRYLPGPMAKLPRRERMLTLVHKKAFAQQPEEIWRAYVDWTAESRLAVLGHQARMLHHVDLRADLPSVRQPVLLIHGEQDSVMPRSHAEALLAGLPSAGLAVLEGSGHVPYYTHPDVLAEAVRQFLTPLEQRCAGQPCPEHVGGS